MRSRHELEIVKNFVDSTYSNFGNKLIVDTTKKYDPEHTSLGFCFKHIDPKTGGVTYKIDCSRIGIERTDFRIMMHEYAHIYLGHLDGIHEELDVLICNAFRDHRPEILELITKTCGIEEKTANRLIERIIDDPGLNHEIHNIAMDMECNSSILSKEDVEEMEMDISSVLPKYAEEALKEAIKNAKSEDYKKELEDRLHQMESEAKIKLIVPERFNLGKDDQDNIIPFPNDLSYEDYLLLIILHIDQFIKMLASIEMGGNGDTKDITKEDIQNALSGMFKKMRQNGAGQQSEAYRQGYQQALRDARQGKIDPSQMKNPGNQDGKSEEYKEGFKQGVQDTVNKNFGSEDFKKGYQDGYNDQMNGQQNPQNQGGQQNQNQGQQGQDQNQQSGQSGQQGQSGQSQQGQSPSGQGQNPGQQGQHGQGQNSGQGQSQDYQNGYSAGQRDAQMSQNQQGQGQQGQNQDGQGSPSDSGQQGSGQSQSQGQNSQSGSGGQGDQGQQDYTQGYNDGKQSAQDSIDQAKQNGGNGQQGQGQQGQGQQGQGQGGSQEMQDYNSGYQQALQDLANAQSQSQGNGLSDLLKSMGISSGGGMSQAGVGQGGEGVNEHSKSDPNQKKGQGREQKDSLNPYEGVPGNQDAGKDHGSDSREAADAKREVGQIQAGGGVGMGRGGGPSVVREVDKFADDVDMALKEVMNDVHSRVVKTGIRRDMMKLYNRGIIRSVIAPSLSRQITISTKPKLVFLIDVSGSMDTRLIDRILNTISRSLKKINRDLRYDIITWSTRLGEHIKDIDPRKGVPKISCGGGTEMALGIKYFKDHYGPEAILVLISDFCDSLDAWHEVEKTMRNYSIWGFNYGDNRYSYKTGDWDWTNFKQRNFSDYGYDD